MPGTIHYKLIEKAKEIFKNFEHIKEGRINDKIIDLILLKNDKIIAVVECLVTQSISSAKIKLKQLPYKKVILRYKKDKPTSKRMISQLQKNKINFIEISEEDIKHIDYLTYEEEKKEEERKDKEFWQKMDQLWKE